MNLASDLLTAKEAATALGVSVKTVRRLARDGHLRPVRLRGVRRMYFERRDLAAWAAAREPWRRRP